MSEQRCIDLAVSALPPPPFLAQHRKFRSLSWLGRNSQPVSPAWDHGAGGTHCHWTETGGKQAAPHVAWNLALLRKSQSSRRNHTADAKLVQTLDALQSPKSSSRFSPSTMPLLSLLLPAQVDHFLVRPCTAPLVFVCVSLSLARDCRSRFSLENTRRTCSFGCFRHCTVNVVKRH